MRSDGRYHGVNGEVDDLDNVEFVQIWARRCKHIDEDLGAPLSVHRTLKPSNSSSSALADSHEFVTVERYLSGA